MKKYVLIILFALACCGLSAQEWVVPMAGEWYFDFRDMVSVDEGEYVLGIGCTRTENGYIAKVAKDGDYLYREVHLPGMMLDYHAAVQLDNGNYMVFGVCDDSLCDYNFQKYLRVDVFDGQLEFVSSRTYDVDDDVFDCFVFPQDAGHMRSIVSKNGRPVLAAVLGYAEESIYGTNYLNAVRFYEFDDLGDTIRTVDNPLELAMVGPIKEITYEPHSDNLMMVVKGGNYGYDTGSPGIFVVDADLNIVAHQSMLHLGGASVISDNACEGIWFDGDRIMVDCEQYIGSNFTYHTLYIVDSALHVYADLRLPPYDSCVWIPEGTNTAYVNDSSIFAISCSSDNIYWSNVQQVDVTLIDKHLNLLGRKVFKKENVVRYAGPPAAFNDGGCAIFVSSSNGQHYQGEPFREYEVMKIRREDIEITWDVVKENGMKKLVSPYPNPTNGILNIPIGDADIHSTTLQIFDMKGGKWLDKTIDKHGNLITVDTRNLETGLYVYKVISSSREITCGKFIKE